MRQTEFIKIPRTYWLHLSSLIKCMYLKKPRVAQKVEIRAISSRKLSIFACFVLSFSSNPLIPSNVKEIHRAKDAGLKRVCTLYVLVYIVWENYEIDVARICAQGKLLTHLQGNLWIVSWKTYDHQKKSQRGWK